MIVDVYIKNEKLDLFEDESIVLVLSVADIEDITKNTTDFSHTFTVPATDVNNSIFKHYYNANIDNTFDARTKVDAKIELYNLPYKFGKVMLTKVNVESGNAVSYTIYFVGDLTSLKDELGNDKLADLDLSDYNHEYNGNNVKTGLQSSLHSGALIYSLFAGKQYYYNSLATDLTDTDTLSNIAYNSSSGNNGIQYSDLKPALKLIKIIEAIEAKYDNITFSRDFFGRSEFTGLFMWLNSSDDTKAGLESVIVDWDSGGGEFMNLLTNIGSYYVERAPEGYNSNYIDVGITITPSAGFEDVSYNIKTYVDGQLKIKKSITNGGTGYSQIIFDGADINIGGSHTYEVYYVIETDSIFKFTSALLQIEFEYDMEFNDYIPHIISHTYASEQEISTYFNVQKNIPDLKIIDFLKGLIQMFKLVIIPKKDGFLYVNAMKDYYAQGGIYDVTKYIKTNKQTVSRGTILNEIVYKFSDPTTILNKKFKENNGIAYGDEQAKLYDDEGNLLSGTSQNISVPFEQIIYERLTDTQTGEETNIQYGAVIKSDLTAASPKAHIFYNINNNMGSKTVGFINDVGAKSELTGSINIPSHVNNLTTKAFSTIFSTEFNEYDGQLIDNTLYKNYHEDYILAIFNIHRRNYEFEAVSLPIKVITDIELNDGLKIRSNYYRIDSISIDLVKQNVKLKLINLTGFSLNSFSASPTNINLSKTSQAYSTYVTNLENYTVTKIDTGYDIDWIEVIDDGGGNIIFTVTENTNTKRYINIKIVNDNTLQEILFIISQDGV